MSQFNDIYIKMHAIVSLKPLPRKIKITSAFSTYLDIVCPTIVEDTPQDEHLAKGVCGQFIGIPIEIDDTIENEYYEVVY